MTRARPTVQMLWESDDPEATLHARFGFDGTDAVLAWLTSALRDHWGLDVVSCERIVMSDANALAWVDTSAGRMVAKWSVAAERFQRLAALARLTTWLADHGLPVSALVPDLRGRGQVELDGTSLGLQREIDGDLLDADDPDQVWAVGAVLARLHDALAVYPEADGFPTEPAPDESLGDQVGDWLATAPEHLPDAAVAALRAAVAAAPPFAAPAQLVHGDVRSANVLCAQREVTAVIDFEEARFDHRVAELARTAVLIGTRFHDWAPVSADVRGQLLAGYESVRPLTGPERAWWPVLVLWLSLRMVPSGEDRSGWGDAAAQLADRPLPAKRDPS